MAAQFDLFRPTRRPATLKPRTMLVIDAGTAPDGSEIVRLGCTLCGRETEWVKSRGVKVETKGRVCPSCKGTHSLDAVPPPVGGRIS